MSLPADLRRFRAATKNERAMDILESVLGIAIGVACVYGASVAVLALA